MALHNELGKNGETLAAEFLETKGYAIVCKNWRYKHYEIDIIASKGKKLHFIEVKTRSTSAFGHPEESVTKKKFQFIKNAADEYLFLHPMYRWIQYDIVAITCKKNEPPECFLLEDVFI